MQFNIMVEGVDNDSHVNVMSGHGDRKHKGSFISKVNSKASPFSRKKSPIDNVNYLNLTSAARPQIEALTHK